MSFAAQYLQKHGSGSPLIKDLPDQDLKCIIAIPAYNESGLLHSLDSLFQCDTGGYNTEVIILINSGKNTPPRIIQQNITTLQETRLWIENHRKPGITFHVASVTDLPAKHFGAGLARKLVMDEAVRRFGAVGREIGVIFSLDADTTVSSEYIKEVAGCLQDKGADGCSIRFEHPIEGEEYLPGIYRAILNYELHQRYYLEACRYTGYPWAFHTVGSAFAVTAEAYCREGGMSKRQAGEDFYFIQKVAMRGRFTECNSTCVYPSPRPSDRVPFGTGPDIARQLASDSPDYMTYNPKLFKILRKFFDQIDSLFTSNAPRQIFSSMDPILTSYLEESDFESELSEIRSNVSSLPAFRKRFFSKFNMFRMLKFLHYAEEKGVERVEVGEAVPMLLNKSELCEADKITQLLALRKYHLNTEDH